MENTKAASEQIALPVNYFWSTTDPALPFSGSAMGNPFIFPPSNATRVPTKESYPKGTYPCWDYKKNDWIPRPDYRQIPLWNKQTGVPEISSTIDCPPYLTDVPPTTNYDVWNEQKGIWVTDVEKQNAQLVANRTKQRTTEIALATNQIDQLNDIVEFLDTGDEDYTLYTTLLKEWRNYRSKLNLLKINDLSASFPVRPKLIGD